MGRWVGALVGLTVAVLVLVGCGDSDKATAGAPSSPASGSPSTGDPAQLQLRIVKQVSAPGGTCPAAEPPAAGPATLCDQGGRRYQLEPAAWAGTVAAAGAEAPDMQVQWVVTVDLPEDGTTALTGLSTQHAGDGTQVALVLDGELISAPVFHAPITDGKFQIEGNYTEKTANELVDRLTGR